MLKNPQLLKRRDHTVTSYYYPSLGLSEVLIFGGYDEENMSATTLLEFRKSYLDLKKFDKTSIQKSF